MAKLNEKKPINSTVVEDQEINNSNIQSILDRLNTLEAENKAFRDSKNNIFQSAKEKYQGPWAYSYKMWGGVPVLGYTSFRKDKTKELLYKNDKGMMISNHYLKLELADGNTEEVEVTEFNQHFMRSEKIICEVIGDPKNPQGYKFNDAEYGEFIVNPNIIN